MSKNDKTKLVRNVIKQVVDHQTGEIIEQGVEKHFVTKIKTDNFFMVFFDKLSAFYGLRTAKEKDVMIALCEIAEYNTGVVRITPSVRESLCKRLSIHSSNLSKALKKLNAIGLIKGERGDYIINPEIFWKGSTATRTEILRSEGITFKITLIEENNNGG